jgi:hypothetical protein
MPSHAFDLIGQARRHPRRQSRSIFLAAGKQPTRSIVATQLALGASAARKRWLAGNPRCPGSQSAIFGAYARANFAAKVRAWSIATGAAVSLAPFDLEKLRMGRYLTIYNEDRKIG